MMWCIAYFLYSRTFLTVHTSETMHIKTIIIRSEQSLVFGMFEVVESFKSILFPPSHEPVQYFQAIVTYPSNHISRHLNLHMFAPAIHLMINSTLTTQKPLAHNTSMVL